MADVHCPNCGKSNPEEAEKCLFCGERLSGGDLFKPEKGAADDSADWLSGLRSGDWQSGSDSEPEPDEAEAEENEIPDWLSRVRARSQDEEETSNPSVGAGSADEGEDDTPDWLKNLAGDSQPSPSDADDWLSNLNKEETKPAGGGDADLPFDAEGGEWLSGLRPDETASENPQGEDQPVPTNENASTDDWMPDLSGWNIAGEAESTPETPEQPAASDLPEAESAVGASDWFSGVNSSTDAEPEKPEESETPDWPPKSSDVQPEQTNESDDEAGGLPAWMGDLSAAAAGAEESAEPEELPDWLSRAKPEPDQEETPAPAEEMPDWLKDTDVPSEEPPAVEAAQEEMPDWLSRFGDSSGEAEETPQADAEAGEEAEEGAEMPDFSGLFAQEDAREPEPEEQPETSGESIPDFSALFTETDAEGTEASQGEASEGQPEEEIPTFDTLRGQPEGQEDELPEWLSASQDAADQPAEEAQPAADQPAAEVPDWMKDFDTAGDAGQSEEPIESSAPFVEEDLPAWLDGMKSPPSESAGPGVAALIEPEEPELSPDLSAPFQVELPEWLDENDQAEPGEGEAEPAAAELEDNLEKAELPSWVEDLRPLESVIPGDVRSDTGETLVEKAGPLAGMRGVLQSEDLTARYRKPPVYSARLRVSDRQRSQAAILENLLSVETSSKEVPSVPSRAPQLILRLIIALLLILSLLTMLLPDFRLVDVPATYPGGLTNLYDRVENLPADAAVLLAVDYEPGLSGEMRFSANAVIEHLMVKNARLAIVSTVPTGPVLADTLLAEVRNRRTDYVLSERTVNLGYLPGGTTSLLEFAQDPKRATPYALDTPLSGLLAWEHSAVAGLNSLQDFALVIVLTDSPETGRAWIEQVQPVLGSVPLTMVTSAQAGPMLQPYYDSGQIQGMVVGLQGGAMYEQKAGRVNQANRFYGSYQSGILVGLLLITLGGIISGVMGFSDRKPTEKGKA